MTKAKSTKRALFASAISMLLCVTMLIGSTFAWFTDNASTSVNTIQAGDLKIALEMSKDGGETWEDAEGKSLEFLKAEGEIVLWEPGVTYNLPLLRIRNAGNLALKYAIEITGINGDAKLNEVIEWTVDGTTDFMGSLVSMDQFNINAFGATEDAEYYLLPENDQYVDERGVNYAYINISGHMKEEAGNEYQGLSIEGIAVTVRATQDAWGYDSKDNMYDWDAEYDNGVVISEGPIVVPEGETMVVSGGNVESQYLVDNVGNGLVINDITFTGIGVARSVGGTLTINGGTFNATGLTVDFGDGTAIVIKGGTFNLTLIDNNPNANVTIYGGTFACDPSGFVADGYTATQGTDGMWNVSAN